MKKEYPQDWQRRNLKQQLSYLDLYLDQEPTSIIVGRLEAAIKGLIAEEVHNLKQGWILVTERLPETKEADGVYIIPKGRCYVSKYVLVKKDYPNIGEEFRYEVARYRTYDDGEPDWTCGSGVVAWMDIPE